MMKMLKFITTPLLFVLIVSAQMAHASSDRVYRVQTILNAIGQNAGTADGLYGGKTRRALIAIAPEHNGKTIKDADVNAVEEAYIEKFGNYPVFGSKNSPLPMKIKEKHGGAFAGWNEQIKTELHRLDVSTVNFEFMPFEYYAKDASAYPPSETATWAQMKASRYDCDFSKEYAGARRRYSFRNAHKSWQNECRWHRVVQYGFA